MKKQLAVKVFLLAGVFLFFLPSLGFILSWMFDIPSYRGFLRNEWYRNQQVLFGVLISLFFITPYVMGKYRPQYFTNNTEYWKKNRWAIFLGILLFAWVLPAGGFPPLFYWFANEKRSIETSVTEVDLSPGRSSPCIAEVNVEFDPGILSIICVSKGFAQSIKVHDPLRLSGPWHDWLGLYVEDVELLDRNQS